MDQDQAKAQAAMAAKYEEGRAQALAKDPGLFGKQLDRAARRRAIQLAGVQLPAGMTIAWATPAGWGHGPLGYRGQTSEKMEGLK